MTDKEEFIKWVEDELIPYVKFMVAQAIKERLKDINSTTTRRVG